MKLLIRIAWLMILLHAIIATVHGLAHTRLGINLNTFQSTYVLLVIMLAPIMAAVLLSTRHQRLGFAILVLSLAGSLVFGVYWHYLAESPDNVFHLHEGTPQSLFRLTAILLVLSEGCGIIVGLWGMLKDKNS
jgi:amino acid permease